MGSSANRLHVGHMLLVDLQGILVHVLATSTVVSIRLTEPYPLGISSCFFLVSLAFQKCWSLTVGLSSPVCLHLFLNQASTITGVRLMVSAKRQMKIPSSFRRVLFCRKLPNRCSCFREGFERSELSVQKTLPGARLEGSNFVSQQA